MANSRGTTGKKDVEILEKENAELKSKIVQLENKLKIATSKNNVSVAGGSVRVNDVVRRVEREKEQELDKTGKN